MIIWITGASTGLGRETARQYVEQGHKVFASARSFDKLQQLADECANLNGHLEQLPADVCDVEAMADAYAQIKHAAGIPDLVILNAGTFFPTPAETFSLEDHRSIMEVNYFGVLNGLGPVLPDFIERGTGEIGVVASLAGYRGLPNASAYGASKAALINFCETLKPELESHGVDLRQINPGCIETPLTEQNEFPMPFLMPVGAAATHMIKGLASGGFEITFPTRFAFVMKLLRLLPDRLFFAIARRMLAG